MGTGLASRHLGQAGSLMKAACTRGFEALALLARTVSHCCWVSASGPFESMGVRETCLKDDKAITEVVLCKPCCCLARLGSDLESECWGGSGIASVTVFDQPQAKSKASVPCTESDLLFQHQGTPVHGSRTTETRNSKGWTSL